MTWVELAISLTVLYLCTLFFLRGARALGQRLGLNDTGVGLILVAIPTSIPELVFFLNGLSSTRSESALGVVIGSNVFNLLLVIGLCGVLSKLKVDSRLYLVWLPVSIVALVNLWVMLKMQNGVLKGTFWFIPASLIFIVFGYLKERSRGTGEAKMAIPGRAVWLYLFCIPMVLSTLFVVKLLAKLSPGHTLNPSFTHLIVFGCGTSLPELIASAVATRQSAANLAVANVIGSNIFNLLFILGVSGLIYPIPISTAFNFDLLILIGASVILMVILHTHRLQMLNRLEAVLLSSFYFLYVLYVIYSHTGSN